MSAPAFRHPEAGATVVEMMVACVIFTGVLAVLGSSLSSYSRITSSELHAAQAGEQNRLILEALANELSQATTQRNHPQDSALALPLASDAGAGVSHPAYNFPEVAIGVLHDTRERDGTEYWHPPSPDRRFFIYSTYEHFDTIEFQAVSVGAGGAGISAFMTSDGELGTPWTLPRKILRIDDRVVLRIRRDRDDPNAFDDVVLGTNASDLQFHLDAEGKIVVYLETLSGEAPRNGRSGPEGATHVETRIITAGNEL